LIADGGLGGRLAIESQDVKVTINNGIAVTHVDQVFLNLEDRQVEALYTFPVPAGASVSNFSMWIAGKEMVGEVVEKKRAREIYESYKPARRDPGILEQKDFRTFEMRVFPIAPRAKQRVQVTYYQELSWDHDRATYVYPLRTQTVSELASDRTEGRFSFALEARSLVPVMEMTSASHEDAMVTARLAEGLWHASLEAREGNLSRDVVVTYRTRRAETGIDLLTSRPPGEDGFFQLALTVGDELKPQTDGADYVFVLDVSGSMAHDGKLRLGRESLGAFFEVLGEEDRFEVLAFNVQPTPLFRTLNPVTGPARERAKRFLKQREARGGTILEPALTRAYGHGDADRPLNIVLLSDGMTDMKERTELGRLIESRPANARVFCVGLGNDVNRPLLSQLADETGGLAAFISHDDDLRQKAAALRRKLTRPALTDVTLDFGNDRVRIYDPEPHEPASVFHGIPLRVYGRYAGSGELPVTVRGEVLGKPFVHEAVLDLPKRGDQNPEIERMWAWKRIDRLLKERTIGGAGGPELDEVIRLGEAYSIATEYTSFLVLENDAEYARWKIDRKNALRIERDRASQGRVRDELAALRTQDAERLGPPSEEVAAAAPGSASRSAAPVTPPANWDPTLPIPSSAPRSREAASRPPRRRGSNFGFGSGGGGAVDPSAALIALALLGLSYLGRRKES
jgi:Ca-activated chloride channel family protein